MPKRGPARFLKPVGDPDDPHGLFQAMQRYLDYRKTRGSTEQALSGSERRLRDFISWCDARDLKRPTEITRPILERYQRFLATYQKRNGEPLSIRSQLTQLTPVRSFFSWLAKRHEILANPAADLDLPRPPKRLPQFILSAEDVEAVLKQPNVFEPLGLRDRAVLELLYSSGLRRMELINLKAQDLDFSRKTVFVREGKNRKDRLLPVSDRALHWNKRYLEEVRPGLLWASTDPGFFYLTREGERFNECWISRMVAKYIDRAHIGKHGACHMFRHALATAMLENGADLRYVQAMLGHESPNTTQFYTHVAIRTLQAIHQATHPGCQADAKEEGGDADAGADTSEHA
jgi:integrase/recombinase XerD